MRCPKLLHSVPISVPFFKTKSTILFRFSEIVTFFWHFAHGLLFARVQLRLVFKTQRLRVENEGNDSSKSQPKYYLVYLPLAPPTERSTKCSNFTSVCNSAHLKLHR
ncbi:hypothetical protein Y032_0248g80 [Ancylostoma ceylanicum]|uniref:Uncharacterized protein n=1 Tax=Ancylostoma ceylanicum TaxID=53326 RepID=A0A016SDJ3_9BILA|nr:hypothetical protein Y032_0248g80 [Ancylostoma ceylanicum]